MVDIWTVDIRTFDIWSWHHRLGISLGSFPTHGQCGSAITVSCGCWYHSWEDFSGASGKIQLWKTGRCRGTRARRSTRTWDKGSVQIKSVTNNGVLKMCWKIPCFFSPLVINTDLWSTKMQNNCNAPDSMYIEIQQFKSSIPDLSIVLDHQSPDLKWNRDLKLRCMYCMCTYRDSYTFQGNDSNLKIRSFEHKTFYLLP
jgi:hypothetical protein